MNKDQQSIAKRTMGFILLFWGMVKSVKASQFQMRADSFQDRADYNRKAAIHMITIANKLLGVDGLEFAVVDSDEDEDENEEPQEDKGPVH